MGEIKKKLFGILDIIGDALIEESKKVKAPEIKIPKILDGKPENSK